jgi:hypothetical protein
VSKLDNAAAFGARYFLIDNNVPGLSGIATGNYTAALILPEDGQYLRSQSAAGTPVSLTFPQEGGYTELPDVNGGLVSDFTSYGPTFDLYFKPAVAAPGGNILSTFPVPLGKYAVLSGTSMVCVHARFRLRKVLTRPKGYPVLGWCERPPVPG